MQPILDNYAFTGGAGDYLGAIRSIGIKCAEESIYKSVSESLLFAHSSEKLNEQENNNSRNRINLSDLSTGSHRNHSITIGSLKPVLTNAEKNM